MSQHPKLGYNQQYRGQVVSVSDPKRELRVQVRIFDFFDGVPDADLPWATYNLPVGARPGDGFFIPVKVGDYVWVDFLNGDTRHPRIIAGLHQMPGGTPNLPPEAFAGDGQHEHKRTETEPKPDNPGYHEDVVFKQNGALIQLCQSGAIRVTQITSGSAIEIAKDGQIVLHSEKEVLVSSQGEMLFDSQGSITMRTAKSFNIDAKEQGKMSGGGGLRFSGPTEFEDNVHVSGKLIDDGGNTNHHSH